MRLPPRLAPFALAALLLPVSLCAQTPTTTPGLTIARDVAEVSKLSMEQAKAQLADLAGTLARVDDGRTITMDAVNETVNDLAKERDRVQIVIQGKKAREAALQKRIHDLTAEAQEKTERDSVLQQLTAAADAKKKLAQQVHERVGIQANGEQAELTAISDAAEAAARVHERRDAIASAVGGGVLPQLNRELIEVSLDLTEQQAVLAELDAHLSHWKDVRQLVRMRNELNNHIGKLNFEENRRQPGRSGGRGGFGGFAPSPQLPPLTLPRPRQLSER